MTPEEVIRQIAEVANTVAFHAGVGGSEIAGMIISVLARNPQEIEHFMKHGGSRMIDTDLYKFERGCLTFHSMNGNITTPEQLAAAKGVQKIKRAEGVAK